MRTRWLLVPFLWLAAVDGLAAPLLPDLFPWAVSGTYLHDAYLESSGGRRLLRFSSAVANRGRGALEVRGTPDANGNGDAVQRIYDSEGGFEEVFAGRFEFSGHDGHNHIHLADFAAYRMRAVADGNRLGPVIRTSEKVSFQLFDNALFDGSLPGAPGTGVYFRQEQVSNNPQGISVGWADVYAHTLGDQWIDVTGLAPGLYWLEVEVDPRRNLRESSVSNNREWIKVRLEAGDGDVDTFDDTPSSEPAIPKTADGAPTPNPWVAGAHGSAPMRFGPLSPGDTVEIYAIDGRRVRTVTASGNTVPWDLRNESGQLVATGGYFYVVRLAGGGTRTGRLGVVR